MLKSSDEEDYVLSENRVAFTNSENSVEKISKDTQVDDVSDQDYYCNFFDGS